VLSIEQFTGTKAEEANGDDSGSMFRKIVALVYIFFLFAFAAAFIVLIAAS
jgi:hypothetical protein